MVDEFNDDGYQEEEGEEEKMEKEEGADVSDDESYSIIDTDALEEEALDAVREFSSSLSNQLRLGEFFGALTCIALCLNMFFMLAEHS